LVGIGFLGRVDRTIFALEWLVEPGLSWVSILELVAGFGPSSMALEQDF